MISKVIVNTTKNIAKRNEQGFSVKRLLFDLAYKDDSSCSSYQATHLSPAQSLQGFSGKSATEVPRVWENTKLSNGITVLSESAALPGPVNIGILLNVGSRDESVESSGSLQSIKNTYLKTVLNTNETINYGMVQMSGGNFTMDYNQESAIFQASCLAHDGVDIFNMVADCALEPRSVVTANVGISKNQDSHKLDNFLKTGEHFNEAIFSTAFGLTGLGLPLKGLKGNVENLTSYTLQKFQLDNITPDRIVVAGTGIQDHSEFVQLVQNKLSFIPAATGKGVQARPASKYVGGEVRNYTESNRLDLGLFFQGVNWKSEDIFALNVLTTLLNNFRLQQNVLNKHHFVDSAEALNFHYSDNGLFGLRVSGSAANGKQILESTIAELKSLASKVSEQEVNIAKAALNINIGVALERQSDRLEEGLKNWNQWNAVKFNDYAAQINKVTPAQIQKVVSNIIKTNPTFVVEGNAVNSLPSYDSLRNLLK